MTKKTKETESDKSLIKVMSRRSRSKGYPEHIPPGYATGETGKIDRDRETGKNYTASFSFNLLLTLCFFWIIYFLDKLVICNHRSFTWP